MDNPDLRQDVAEEDEGRFGRGFTFAVKFVLPIWVVIALVAFFVS